MDIDNGNRLVTYAITGARGSGVIGINGAAAHLVHPGHLVIVIAYGTMEDAEAREYQPRVVFVDADKSAYAVYYEQAVRMLRPGGVVAFDNMLWHDRVADPSQRDTETVVLRELAKTVRDDDRLVSVLLASGDGLLVAAKR